MAKKCLACDLVYSGEREDCPSCGKVDHLAVIDPTLVVTDSADVVTRCGILLVANGLITLVFLVRQALGVVSLILGVLLLLKSERTVHWVKAAQFVKLAILAILFLVGPRLLYLLAAGEALAVLGLLSKNERYVRLGTITFAAIMIIGVLATLLPSLPVIRNL